MKRTNKALIAVLAIIPAVLFATMLIAPLFIIKNTKNIEYKFGKPNFGIEGMELYVPSTWKEENNYLVSPSENCRIISGITYNNQETLEQEYFEKELEHKNITLNDIEMSYGYKNDGIEKVYSYYFEFYDNQYFIIFRNNIDSDEECDDYVEKLEKSITLYKEGKRL